MRFWIYIAFLAIVLSSCGDSGVERQFDNVESLMADEPALALDLIEDVIPKTESERARHALLLTKARYRNRLENEEDSVIKIAVDYYNGRGDSLEYQSLFFYGVALYNQGKYDKALITEMEVEELASRHNDYFYMAMSQREQSDVYNKLFVFNKCLEVSQMTVDNFDKAGRRSHAAWAGIDWAYALSGMGHGADAVNEMNAIVLKYPEMRDDISFMSEWHRHMSGVQSRLGRYRESNVNLHWLIDNGRKLSSNEWASLSDNYVELKDVANAKAMCDSARATMLSRRDSMYVRYLEGKIYALEGNFKAAFYTFKEAKDSIDSQRDFIMTHPYTSLVNDYYRLKVAEEKSKADESRMTMLLIFVSAVLFISILVIILLLAGRALNRTKMEASVLLVDVARLRSEIELSNDVRDALQEDMGRLFRQNFDMLNDLCRRWYSKARGSDGDKEFCGGVIDVLSGINSDEMRGEIEVLVNRHKGNLMGRFREQCQGLSAMQYELALLSFAGFSWDSISVLTGKSINSIYVAKHRLRKFVEEADCRDVVEFIGYIGRK